MSEYYDAQADALIATWNAIEKHEDTATLFNRKFKFMGESPLVAGTTPSFSDLDSIWIMPSDSLMEPTVNTKDTDNLRLSIVTYTKDWNVLTPMRNLFKLKRAFARAKMSPDSGSPIMAAYDPRISGQQTTYQPVILDDTNKIQCIKTTMVLVLRIPFQH
jgi:hypothetical protein